MKILIVIGLMTLGMPTFAHEGAHGPEQKVAPHGGVLRDSASLMFELVRNSGEIKIFPISHDGKPLETKKIELDLKKTSLSDSKKKAVPFELVPGSTWWTLKFAKGASHRYAFKLVGKFDGLANQGEWQIEMGEE